MPHLRRIFRRVLPVVLVILFASPVRARAGDEWQPLPLLAVWRYATDAGGVEEAQITRRAVVLGQSVAVKHWFGGVDDGLEQYWSCDDAGTVFLAGFDRTLDGFALAYQPPIVILQAPPSLGLKWTDDATIYTLPDLSPGGTLHIQWTILEDGVLDLPIGSVPTFGVGQTGFAAAASMPTVLADRGLRVDGRRAPVGTTTNDPGTTDWFSRFLGIVQFNAGGTTYRATDVAFPDAAVATSWGRVKRLYR